MPSKNKGQPTEQTPFDRGRFNYSIEDLAGIKIPTTVPGANVVLVFDHNGERKDIGYTFSRPIVQPYSDLKRAMSLVPRFRDDVAIFLEDQRIPPQNLGKAIYPIALNAIRLFRDRAVTDKIDAYLKFIMRRCLAALREAPIDSVEQFAHHVPEAPKELIRRLCVRHKYGDDLDRWVFPTNHTKWLSISYEEALRPDLVKYLANVDGGSSLLYHSLVLQMEDPYWNQPEYPNHDNVFFIIPPNLSFGGAQIDPRFDQYVGPIQAEIFRLIRRDTKRREKLPMLASNDNAFDKRASVALLIRLWKRGFKFVLPEAYEALRIVEVRPSKIEVNPIGLKLPNCSLPPLRGLSRGELIEIKKTFPESDRKNAIKIASSFPKEIYDFWVNRWKVQRIRFVSRSVHVRAINSFDMIAEPDPPEPGLESPD